MAVVAAEAVTGRALPHVPVRLLCVCVRSPANPDAARLLATNPKEYKKRVRRLAEKSIETS